MSQDYPPDYALQREVKALRLMSVLLVSLVLFGLMLGNLFAVFQIPKVEKVFEELLGDRNKLPMLSKWVISYGRLGGLMLPLALVAVVPVSTSVIYVLFRKTLWAQVFAASVILFLTAHWVVIYVAMQIPLLQIIQGVQTAP